MHVIWAWAYYILILTNEKSCMYICLCMIIVSAVSSHDHYSGGSRNFRTLGFDYPSHYTVCFCSESKQLSTHCKHCMLKWGGGTLAWLAILDLPLIALHVTSGSFWHRNRGTNSSPHY